MHDHESSSLVAEPTDDVARQVSAERARLREEGGLGHLQQFKKA